MTDCLTDEKVIPLCSPNETMMEKVFVNKNSKSSLTLGYVRMIAVLALKIKEVTHLTLMPDSVILPDSTVVLCTCMVKSFSLRASFSHLLCLCNYID
jgi:hypothetical protein